MLVVNRKAYENKFNSWQWIGSNVLELKKYSVVYWNKNKFEDRNLTPFLKLLSHGLWYIYKTTDFNCIGTKYIA